jgi:hypothetical protein
MKNYKILALTLFLISLFLTSTAAQIKGKKTVAKIKPVTQKTMPSKKPIG